MLQHGVAGVRVIDGYRGQVRCCRHSARLLGGCAPLPPAIMFPVLPVVLPVTDSLQRASSLTSALYSNLHCSDYEPDENSYWWLRALLFHVGAVRAGGQGWEGGHQHGGPEAVVDVDGGHPGGARCER